MTDTASPPPGAPSTPRAERFRSLDVLRGLIILVMIFVNDVAGVEGVPAWMKHFSPPRSDGMTFVDVVFPAFLFIVGVAIPFGLGRRLERGDRGWTIWKHILSRTLSLLLIGVLMVNAESISDRGRLSPALWSLLMYAGVFLVWTAPPRGSWPGVQTRLGLRAAGVALLLLLAVLYRGRGEASFIELRPHWWGILGLIGWAYLVACTVYFLLRNQLAGVVGTIPVLYCLYVAHAVGAFSGWTWLTRWIEVGPMLGSHAAVTVSGLALGIVLASSPPGAHTTRLRWGLLFGLALALAAHLLHAAHDVHPMFIVNKILATPPWCLWTSAITTALWALLYWLIEVRHWTRWASLLEAAGQNPLTAYLLSMAFVSVFPLFSQVTGLRDVYGDLGDSFGTGLLRSVLFAILVTWLAGRLRRLGVQLAL